MLVQRLLHGYGAARSCYVWQSTVVWAGRKLDWVRPRNFLILGEARAGTTLLVDYLNCHRRVRCRGEILGEGAWLYGYPYRRNRQRLKLHVESLFVARPGIWAGAKILTYHVDELPLKLADILDLLHQPRVFVLYREDTLEQFVSLRLAEESGVWHTDRPTKNSPIAIDPQQYLGFRERKERMWRECMAELAGEQVHAFSYERLTRQTAVTMRGAFGHLGLEPRAVGSKLVKLNPRPLADKVMNYQELVALGLATSQTFQPPMPGRMAPGLRRAG